MSTEKMSKPERFEKTLDRGLGGPPNLLRGVRACLKRRTTVEVYREHGPIGRRGPRRWRETLISIYDWSDDSVGIPPEDWPALKQLVDDCLVEFGRIDFSDNPGGKE